MHVMVNIPLIGRLVVDYTSSVVLDGDYDRFGDYNNYLNG